MENQVLSGKLGHNQFVQMKAGGIESFGIIADFDAQDPSSSKSVNLMLVDMEDDFGTYNCSISDIRVVSESEIRSNLIEVLKRYEEFPYFIIQLNDISELSNYHLEENDTIKEIRKTNDVLNTVI